MVKNAVFIIYFLAVAAFGFAVYKGLHWFKTDPKNVQEFSKLVVYASSSFMDSYGPGKDLKAEFEKQCSCHVEYVDAGGGSALIQRLKLPAKSRVDVVLDLDLLLLAEAASGLSWKKLNFEAPATIPELNDFKFNNFVAYDWAPVAFLYNEKKLEKEYQKIGSWNELLKVLPKKSISIPDPQFSNLGKLFQYWFYSALPDWDKHIEVIKTKLHSQTTGWSQSYGMFRKNEVPVVLSYISSLVYHREVEKDNSVQALIFSEGHPVQIQYGGVPNQCVTCDYGRQFLEFLTTETAQKILMEKNFMYPVRPGMIENSPYAKLPKVKILTGDQLDQFYRVSDTVDKEWAEAAP